MGLLTRLSSLLTRTQRRSSTLATGGLGNPSEELLRALGASGPARGVSVTESSAMRIAAVYACVRVIAESVAQLPLKLYRKTPAGPEEVTDHPAARLLTGEPNGWQTELEFREMLAGICALRGNAFAVVERNPVTFEPVSLIPVHPSRVRVNAVNGGVSYEIEGRRLGRYDVLHYRGLSSGGLLGDSPVSLMRGAMSLAATLERTSTSLFANGAKPGGVLEHPNQLSDEAAKRIKETFDAAHAGAENAAGTLVLEEGMKWHQIGLSFEDAQLLESKKFSVEEIARAFRVPLHMIQSTEKSTSWGSGIEQMTIGFIVFTLAPWLRRIEATNRAVLLTEDEKAAGFYFKHNVNALQRGDFKTRMEGYQLGLLNGIYSINEVRDLEEMRQLPDAIGGVHRVPVNTAPAGQQQPAPANQGDPSP